MNLLNKIFAKSGKKATGIQQVDFIKWLINENWDRYISYRMNKRKIIEKQINNLKIKLSNGTVRKEYNASFNFPKELVSSFTIEDSEELGLEYQIQENNNCNISGKPSKVGDFIIKILCNYNGMIDGEEPIIINLPIAFNPDPRSLWKDIPTSKNVVYFKEDNICEYIKCDNNKEINTQKNLVAVSNRGRSHANEGKARDDHYKIEYCEESGWYLLAVADGAGSAKYSRKGSEIACETVIKYCLDELKDPSRFEEKILAYNKEDEESVAYKEIKDEIYNIIGNAAFKAYKAIEDVSKVNEDVELKDFATTLMFAICKKFSFGWFIASYWVGDGAMCLYDEESSTARLLGKPDEGEYSGQTKFLTMPEIFKDGALISERLKFSIEKKFTSLILMTDGVSDPMFETINNLNNFEKWKEFWNKLKIGFPEDEIKGVNFSKENEEMKDQLLNWLNFWSQGNHDDRTIALLY